MKILTFRIEAGEKLLLSSFRSILIPIFRQLFRTNFILLFDQIYCVFVDQISLFALNDLIKFDMKTVFHFKSQKQLRKLFSSHSLVLPRKELCHLAFFRENKQFN